LVRLEFSLGIHLCCVKEGGEKEEGIRGKG
jgi:hypothetical protein